MKKQLTMTEKIVILISNYEDKIKNFKKFPMTLSWMSDNIMIYEEIIKNLKEVIK